MSNIKPRTYELTLAANTPTKFTPLGEKPELTSAYGFQNDTGADVFFGGEDSQLWKVPNNTEYVSAGIDESGGGSHSETSTDDIWLLSPTGGRVVIQITKGA